MNLKSALLLSMLGVATLALPSFPVAAQLSEKEKQQQEQIKKQELDRKTYSLVDEIAGGALSLKLPENRSFVLASAADLLWSHDEPRARNLFWDALNIINLMNGASGSSPAMTDEKDAKKLTTKEKEQRLQEYYAVFGLRQELLRRVARRDPQLALDMLRSSRQFPAEQINGRFHPPDERELEQQIAAEAAARDPERALQLAHESLAKGLSFQLFELLFRLNLRDAAAGTRFAGEIIDKLHTRNLSTDPYASRIAVSLLEQSRDTDDDAYKKGPGRPVQLKLQPEQRRELVELVTNAALESSADTNLLYALNDVMPDVEQFAPERSAAIQRKLAAFNQTLNPQQKVSLEYNSMFRTGTPEDMLKLANRAGDDRGWMQEQAIVMAVMRRRGDSLREFINTNIDDAGRRRELLDKLDTKQIDDAVYKGDVEDLRKLLPQIRRREERARAMAGIAVKLEKKGEHDEALRLLDEAQTMIKTDLTSESQTNALLTLTAAYAQVEPNRAFAIIEQTIDRANDEVSKALFLEKIVKTGAVKKGELRLAQSGMVPIDFALFKYGDAVSAIAKVDFDRTKAAADRFERYELRLMARLLLAQALLRIDSKKIPDGEQ
jgi:hypothetical protein